jgi:DNA-binding beta-propeller fold protein YncE
VAVTTRFGSGRLQFELVDGWQSRPVGWPLEDIAGVSTDADDNVYLYARGEHPVSIYTRDGEFVDWWGQGHFSPRSHGTFLSRDGDLFLVDDGLGLVGRYSLDGKLLATIGPVGVVSDTGHQPGVDDSVTHSGPPYNKPTNLSIGPNGDLYVSDGYGNARVHRFDPDGTFIQSWGQPGSGAGQFHIPHGLRVHRDGRVFVADRQNDRIQIFDPDGRYLNEWTDVRRPQDIFIDHNDLVYVAELSWYPGERSGRLGPVTEYLPARLSIYDIEGNLLLRWADPDPTKDGYFTAPHGIWVDNEGSIYLAEVAEIWSVSRGYAPPDVHRLQKFARA